MGVIFISHSSRDNDPAIKIRDWLRVHGWGETFLDLDPAHGLAPGQRWQEELKKAGERCSAVVVLISPNWVASKWCQVEFLLASQLGKLIFGIIIVPTSLTDLPIELTAHYQIVDISSSDKEADGYERLRFGLKRAGLDPKDFPWPPTDEPHRPPYRGLRALEEKDAGIFFGRDSPITRGLDTLRRMRDGTPERMLVVLGASGAGKSSFLKAGMLARLQRDEQHFLVLPTVRPERAALTGPQGLLHACGLSAVPTPEALKSRFAALRQPVMDRLQRHAEAARESHRTKPPTLLLAIDQAEELFASDSTETSATLDLLSAAFGIDDNLLAVITIRSDSYASLQGERRLGDVPRLPFDLPRLSPGAFKEVIEGPGRLAKPEIVFESALTDRLAADLDNADALPLLAFTLERLVADYGKDGKLLLDEYERGLGGLDGAITKAIDAAFAAALADASLPSERTEIEALARRALIPWLVRVDEVEGAPKRRVAALSELPPEAGRLVRHLIDQRLLVTDVRAGEAIVEVSHEAVLRHWRALSAWIDEDRANLRALEAVRTAASEWRRRTFLGAAAPSDSWLVHRGERLVDAETLLGRPDYAQVLGEEGRAYLEACRARHNVERAEESRRLRRRRLGAAAIVLLLLTGAGLVARQLLAEVENAKTRSVARARELALQARERIDVRFHHALLLGVAGTQVSDTVETRAALQAALASRAGMRRLFHSRMTSPIRAAAISRDGKLVAVGGCAAVAENDVDCTKGQVQIWNVESGMEIGQPLVGHGEEVTAIAFDADGSRLYSASPGDGTMIEWDVGSGRSSELKLETGAAPEPGRVAFTAQFSSNGDNLAVGTFDGKIGVWNIAARRRRGAMLAVFTGEDESVASLAFSPDGNTLVAGSTGGELSVVTVGESLALRSRLKAHEAWVEAVAITGAELSVSAGRDGNMTIRRGEKTATYPWGAAYPYAIFLSPDGEKALIGAAGGEVQIWSTHASRSPETRLADVGIPLAFQWSSRTLLSRVDERVLAVSQPFSAVPVASDVGVGAVAFDPRGELLAIGRCAEVANSCKGGTVKVIDLRSGRPLWERPAHDHTPDWMRFSPDGERLVSANQIYSPTIVVWNTKSGLVERELVVSEPTHRGLTSIDFSFDGKWAAVADCAVPKDDTYCKEGYVRLWDLEKGQAAPWTFSGLIDGAQSVAFSPDGRWIAASADDGKILVWDIDSRRQVLSLPAVFESDRGVSEGAYHLAFAAGREALVAESSSGAVAVWDLGERRLLVPPINDMAGGGALVVHPVKRQVAVVNQSREVLLWDFETGEFLVPPLLGHDVRQSLNSFVNALVFSPDGQTLVAGGEENGVLSWRLPEDNLQLRACRIVNRDFTDDEWAQFMGAEPRRKVCPPEALRAP